MSSQNATSRNLSPASRSHGTLPRVKLQQSFTMDQRRGPDESFLMQEPDGEINFNGVECDEIQFHLPEGISVAGMRNNRPPNIYKG